jgi:hypothetical protein
MLRPPPSASVVGFVPALQSSLLSVWLLSESYVNRGRGRRVPETRLRRGCLIPVDVSTAATASTAFSADSAPLTSDFGSCYNPQAHCSLQRFVTVVISPSHHDVIAPAAAGPAGTRRRPGPGGRVRPAADGRAGPSPFRFRNLKEHDRDRDRDTVALAASRTVTVHARALRRRLD